MRRDRRCRCSRKYRRARKKNPRHSKTSLLLNAALAAKLGQHARAAEIYSRAVAASPTSFDALDGLVRALRKQGKPKIAQAYQLYRESIPAKRR